MAADVKDLTTLEKVKKHAGITVGADDVLIQEILTGVSRALEKAMAIVVAEEAITLEQQRSAGFDSILTDQRMKVAPTAIKENGTALVAADWIKDGDRRLVRLSDVSTPALWSIGLIEITYTAGYGLASVAGEIPEDIDLACRQQTAFEFSKSQPGGNKLGKVSVSSPTGTQAGFVEADFLPYVQRVVNSYMRRN